MSRHPLSLFCPGCGRFLVALAAQVALQVSCDRCKSDVELQIEAIAPERTLRGAMRHARMIVVFPANANTPPACEAEGV